MDFGPLATAQAEGSILAHSTRTGSATLKKGRRLTAQDIADLLAAGHEHVVVARLNADDVTEDCAAERIAAAAAGAGLQLADAFTGRVNLHAEHPGIFLADKAAVDAMNRIDPALTLATLPNYARVDSGRMIATAKVIAFAASEQAVAAAELAVRASLTVHPFKLHRIGLIATRLPHLKESTMDKTHQVLKTRLEGTGSTILTEIRTEHSARAVAKAMIEARKQSCDFFILFGASAVVDQNDVLPAAVGQAGGQVLRFGLPVDPGNLLLTGAFEGCPVIGAPGCARSPRENGFDWVLDRTLAGLPPSEEDMTGWGVGGLLMEIHSRPQPRENELPSGQAKTDLPVAAVVLAAGLSRRMGTTNKLLADIHGTPLIRRTVEAAISSQCEPVRVVLGHDAENIRQALAGLPVTFVDNPDYASGMGSSVRTGIHGLPEATSGALVLLGDMPDIDRSAIDRLIQGFRETHGRLIVAAGAEGQRANPVLWPRGFFAQLSELSGDIGARAILEENRDSLQIIEVGTAARLDIDTPNSLANYMQQPRD